MLQDFQQMLWGVGYYSAILLFLRLSGKRLAGQTSTLDLIILIAVAVALQSIALHEGQRNAVIFILAVFALHYAQMAICAKSTRVRHFIRGRPRPLISAGIIDRAALADEFLSHEELLAGLRKLGFDSPDQIQLAVLEETGQISAVAAKSP